MNLNLNSLNRLDKIARFLLGLILIFSGVNYFLGILTWFEMTSEARNFIGALLNTNYIFPLVKSIEILAGLLFLLNRFVILASLIIFPGIINIFLFHAFLDFNGLYMAVLLIVLLGIIVVNRRSYFSFILKA